MSSHDAGPPLRDAQHRGTTREFMEFARGERERRNNAEDHFDPDLFDAAVEYIVQKLTTPWQETGA